MFKDKAITLRLTLRQIIILLIIAAGLTYLIWPRIMYSSVPGLQPAASLPVAPEPAINAPASNRGTTTIKTPTRENPALVAAQVTTPTATTTPTPAPSIEDTSSVGTPRSLIVNQATADYLDALARAAASLNGTATSSDSESANSSLAAATSTASATAITLVVVTETPTPQNMITAAAQAARATAVATAIGTYTPMPWNWVVPIVVEPEPATAIPANAATAAFQMAEATAAAFVNGTPTPVPINVWTATPTPFMWSVIGEVATPWIPPSPTPMPLPIPQELVGKILFLSDRSGGPEPLPEPLVYVIDPDGSNLAVLNDDALYQTALARDSYSADQRYRTFSQVMPRYSTDDKGSRFVEMVQTIFMYDDHYKVDQQITFFGTGEAWDPIWSPTENQIAFVSDESDHAEIWIVNSDGSEPLQMTQTNEALFSRELGKDNFILEDENGHPSWSPDGSQIVFWSYRDGHRQLWVMDADGSNAYSLSTTGHDDWDPIWIKYTDPAHEPKFGIKFPPSNATPKPHSDKGGEDDDRAPPPPDDPGGPAEPTREPLPGEEPPDEEPTPPLDEEPTPPPDEEPTPPPDEEPTPPPDEEPTPPPDEEPPDEGPDEP
jgi:hypothetical protein